MRLRTGLGWSIIAHRKGSKIWLLVHIFFCHFLRRVPDPHTEVRAFHIEVKSKLVQVAQATLHIEANLTGLRHLMYRHSWFSAFMGIGTNILIFTTIIGVSWTKFRMGGASTTSMVSMSGDAEEQVQSEEADLVQDLGPGPLSGDGDSVPQAARGQPSIANKMKWFLLRQAFKVLVFIIIHSKGRYWYEYI